MKRAVRTLTALTLASALHARSPESRPEQPSSCSPAWIPSVVNEAERFVVSMATGPDGFVYFGGYSGLHRMEGGRARSWRQNPIAEGGLGGGEINALLPHGDGLWLATNRGLYWFELTTGRFEHVPLASFKVPTPYLFSLIVDNSRLLIGSSEGAVSLNLNDWSQNSGLVFSASERDPEVFDFIQHDGVVYAATSDGLQREVGPGHFELLELGTEHAHSQAIRTLSVDSQNQLLAAGSPGLVKVDTRVPSRSDIYNGESGNGFPEGTIDTIAVDAKGVVWFGGTGVGLYRWSPGQASPVACRIAYPEDNEVGEGPTLLEIGPDGRLAMGIEGLGVRTAAIGSGITRLTNDDLTLNSPPASDVWSADMDRQGRLLLATRSRAMRETSVGSGVFEALADGESSPLNLVYIAELDPQRLFFGIRTSLALWQDGELTELPVFNAQNGEPPMVDPRVVRLTTRQVVVSTTSGIVVLNRDSLLPEQLFTMLPELETFNDAPVSRGLVGYAWDLDLRGSRIYASGEAHIQHIDLEQGAVVSSVSGSSEPGPFGFGRADAIAASADGAVFVGTDIGLLLMDADFSNPRLLQDLNGFRPGFMSNAVSDDEGHVWLASDLGILKLDAQGSVLRQISRMDGLLSNFTIAGSLRLTPEGQLISPAAEGVSVISTDLAAGPPSTMPLVAIDADTGFAVSSGETLSLGPETRFITIEFATTGFVEVDRFAVDYTIESASNSSRGRLGLGDPLRLQELAPGSYEIRAVLNDASGQRSELSALNLQVQPYWWETPLVYLLAGVILMIVLATILYLRYRGTRRRYKLISDERRRIAQDLHDSVMQELIAARMLQRSLAGAQQDPALQSTAQQVEELIGSASTAARSTVSALTDVGDMPAFSDAVRKIQPAVTRAQPTAIIVEEEGAAWSLRPQRCFFLLRVVQEAINNACKHAQASSVTVTLRWEPRYLTVTVSDDGSGFDVGAETGDGGFGLRAMRRMADAGRGRLYIKSDPESGTQVRLEVKRYRF